VPVQGCTLTLLTLSTDHSDYFTEHHAKLLLMMEMQIFSLVGSGFLNIIYIYFKPCWLYVCVKEENLLWASHENVDETCFVI
jgi:hypothetical protein